MTTNTIQTFIIPEQIGTGFIRSVAIDGKSYFVGKDIAEALGYKDTDGALRKHVDAEDKLTRQFDGSGQSRNMTIINESGMYSLILSSKLESAKRFKRWVTSEVLPTIRRTGMYAVDELISNPDLAIQAFTALKAEREKVRELQLTTAIQKQQISELQPKASYYDVVLNCKDLVSVSVIAKDYGKTACWLNRYLKEKDVQFKQGNIWLLKKKYAERGYTMTKTHTHNGNDGQQPAKVHTYWTQSGRLFIYHMLKADGVLPIVERKENQHDNANKHNPD